MFYGASFGLVAWKAQRPNVVVEFVLLRVVLATLITIALQMSVVHMYYLYSGSGYVTALQEEFNNRGIECYFLHLQNSVHDRLMLGSQLI